MEPRCAVCQKRPVASDREKHMEACTDCITKLGVAPLPPARRPRTPCMRCQGKSFLRALPREHVYFAQQAHTAALPLYATAPVRPGTIELDAQQGVGLLEAYICRACGFVEWFCADADKIPAHPLLMTEVIDLDDGGSPYR